MCAFKRTRNQARILTEEVLLKGISTNVARFLIIISHAVRFFFCFSNLSSIFTSHWFDLCSYFLFVGYGRVCSHSLQTQAHTHTLSPSSYLFIFIFSSLAPSLFSSPSSSSPRLRSVQKYTLFLLNFGKRLAGLGVFFFLLLIQRPRTSRFSCLFVRFPPFSSPLSHTPRLLLLLFCNHIIT